MCCPAGEHVNTEGGKILPTSCFSHRPETPPVTHGGKEEGGNRGRVRWMRRRGMNATEGLKRCWMVGGKKESGRKGVAREK